MVDFISVFPSPKYMAIKIALSTHLVLCQSLPSRLIALTTAEDIHLTHIYTLILKDTISRLGTFEKL